MFIFNSVSAPLPPPLAASPPASSPHSLITHSLMTHSLNDSLTDSLPDSLTDSLPDSLTDSHSHSLKGSGVRPGVPPVPWSPPILRGRYGTICTAKGSDVRPGVPLVVLGFRRFCVAASVICQGVGCSPWCPSGVPPSGVPPVSLPSEVPLLRCPSGTPYFPPLLRGRRRTTCTAKGRMYALPWRTMSIPKKRM